MGPKEGSSQALGSNRAGRGTGESATSYELQNSVSCGAANGMSFIHSFVKFPSGHLLHAHTRRD